MMNELEVQYNNFLETRFPRLKNLDSPEDICLISLDSNTAGCISSFITLGKLNDKKTYILKDCYQDLCTVSLSLEKAEKAYFTQLRDLAELTLKAIGHQ